MPELPEVESLRRYLVAERVPGRVITSAVADWPGVENTRDGAAGLSTLPGRRIVAANRHGKQLVLPLDRGVLGLHMGMTGRLVVLGPDGVRCVTRGTRSRSMTDGASNSMTSADGPAAVLTDSEDELTGRLGPDARFHQRHVRRAGRRPEGRHQAVAHGPDDRGRQHLRRRGPAPVRDFACPPGARIST